MRPSCAKQRLAAVNGAPDGTNIAILRLPSKFHLYLALHPIKACSTNTIGGMTNDQFKGGTCLYGCRFRAVVTQDRSAGRRAVVLFTDGVNEDQFGKKPCSMRPTDTVIKNANDSQQTPIYTMV